MSGAQPGAFQSMISVFGHNPAAMWAAQQTARAPPFMQQGVFAMPGMVFGPGMSQQSHQQQQALRQQQAFRQQLATAGMPTPGVHMPATQTTFGSVVSNDYRGGMAAPQQPSMQGQGVPGLMYPTQRHQGRIPGLPVAHQGGASAPGVATSHAPNAQHPGLPMVPPMGFMNDACVLTSRPLALCNYQRNTKVCRTCNKTHDHVHHLPIGNAVRAVRLSDKKDCRVDICGGCYKWAKRHFAGGHRRCDGGAIRRSCQERLDAARENDLLLVRWPTGASEEGAIAAAVNAAHAHVEALEALKKVAKSNDASDTAKGIDADDGSARSDSGADPRSVGRTVVAVTVAQPDKTARGPLSLPTPVSTCSNDASGADFNSDSGDLPSPSNALQSPAPEEAGPTWSHAAKHVSKKHAADGEPEHPQPSQKKRRRRHEPDSDTAGLLGVLASVACGSH